MAEAGADCPLFMTRPPSKPSAALDALAALIDEEEEEAETAGGAAAGSGARGRHEPGDAPAQRKRKHAGMGSMQVQLALTGLAGGAVSSAGDGSDAPSGAEAVDGKRRRVLSGTEIVQGQPAARGERIEFSDDDMDPAEVVAPPRARPAVEVKAAARPRVRWSETEVENLRYGVERHDGLPNMWATILSKYEFHLCRTSVDLKDKWRNLNK